MNFGIYAALFEQFLLAMLVAILGVATPSSEYFVDWSAREISIEPPLAVVGASVPGFAKVVLSIICFVAAGTQILGFIGVFQVCGYSRVRCVP